MSVVLYAFPFPKKSYYSSSWYYGAVLVLMASIAYAEFGVHSVEFALSVDEASEPAVSYSLSWEHVSTCLSIYATEKSRKVVLSISWSTIQMNIMHCSLKHCYFVKICAPRCLADQISNRKCLAVITQLIEVSGGCWINLCNYPISSDQ